MYRSDKVPFGKSFGTIVVERAVDLAALGLITLTTIYIAGDDFIHIWDQLIAKYGAKPDPENDGFPWLYVIAGVFILGMLLVLWKAKKDLVFREKIVDFFKGIWAGIFAIFKSKSPFGYIFHTILIWTCYLLMFSLPFYALESTQSVPLNVF